MSMSLFSVIFLVARYKATILAMHLYLSNDCFSLSKVEIK